ncbi:MAG: VWA domain-containing protein [Verrucomicrobia bacterium]|nr:VWA domain-containing protein [Verrucomicrobiota bacterium]MCH8510328.1 VWA domain-containing protein [Kiritimatiellia bacterium]
MSAGFNTWKHFPLLAGTLALAGSVLLHAGLVRLNPDLFFGGGRVIRMERAPGKPATQLDEVRLVEVRREMSRLVDRFGLASDLEMPELEPDTVETDTEAFPDAEEEMLAGDVEGASPDTTLPEFPDTDSDWQPMQEVLSIAEDRMREEIAALPRAVRSSEYQVPDAPDIALPADFSDDPDLNLAAPMFREWGDEPGDGPENLSRRSGRPDGPEKLPVSVELGAELIELAPLDTDIALRATEDAGEITTLEAVENLLHLETRTFVDPADPQYRYFKIQLVRAGIEDLPVMSRQVVFMIDCSASMTHAMLREAVEGVRQALDTLSPGDTFNIIAFRDDVDVLFPQSRPVNAVNLARARAFLAQLNAFGSTDVFASLEALRAMEVQPGQPLISFLITDGIPTMGLTDSSDIIETFTRKNKGEISIFSVGGGRQVNRYLIDFLSYRNRGESVITERNRQLPESIVLMAKQVANPVLSHLDYRFTGAEDMEVYPKTPTHLYLDRSLILVGRLPADRTRVAFQVVGQSARESRDMIYTVDLSRAPRGSWDLRQEWAWQALLHHVGEYLGDSSEARLQVIRDLSKKYGLQVPYSDRLPGE